MMPGCQRYPGCQDNFAESVDAVNKMTDMDACRAIDGVRSRGVVLEVSGQLSLYRTGQLMPRSWQWAVARAGKPHEIKLPYGNI